MAQVFGNSGGPVYPLGQFSPTSGTPLPLSTNVKVTDSFGTSANPTPIKCNQIKVMASNANTGMIFLVFKSTAASAAGGTSVLLAVPPSAERVLEAKNIIEAFTIDQMGCDTSHTGDTCWITLVIA